MTSFRDACGSIPAPGNGCHPAILSAANCGVLEGLDDRSIFDGIRQAIAPGHRKVTDREINDAIAKARATARTETLMPAGRSLGWGDVLPGYAPAPKGGNIVGDVAPDPLPPPAPGWDGADDMRRYLEAVFLPEEKPSICVRSFQADDGHLRPGGPGFCGPTRGQLVEQLSGGVANAVGTVGEGGAWIRVNPMDGQGCGDRNVTAYRNALIESDIVEPEKQLAIIRQLNLPCAAIVHSGGKSIHAIVRIEATSLDDYHERYDYLCKVCRDNGLAVDTANRNPSRYTRLPGVMRGERKQYLIGTDCGAGSWQEWVDQMAAADDDLPEILEDGDWLDSPPPLADCIIEGVLRKQHKMTLTAPSKAGKSFLLMELALAVASGGTWLGHRCAKGKCLYVNLEVADESCLNRLHEIAAIKGRPPRGSLGVWNLRGRAVPMNLLAPRLIRRCKGKGYSMIIIDPLYKIITGDENSASEMAAFTAYFDRVAMATGAALVVCHHHSKGLQGEKRAMDRGSGSGVFARDPDALIDLVPLMVSDDQRKRTGQAWAAESLAGLLDAGQPGWRRVVPLASQADFQTLRQTCAGSGLAEEAEATAERMQEAVKAAGLFRVDGILREFPPLEPTAVWFRWPVHLDDTTGLCAVCRAEGEMPTADDRRRADADKAMLELDAIMDAYADLAECGQVTVAGLAEAMGRSESSLRQKINRYGKQMRLKITKGVIDED